MPPHAHKSEGFILQRPEKDRLGLTNPALPDTWQKKWFLRQEKTQEDCSVLVHAVSQLGMTVNLKNQFSVCSLCRHSPGQATAPLTAIKQHKKWLPAWKWRSGATVCWAWGQPWSTCYGACRWYLQPQGQTGWVDKKWFYPFRRRMSRSSSRRHPRSLTVSAWAPLAL